ncbi:hypothetical protein [Nocardia terpenica]|uniref:DUF3291 domain-containing protein n=1 Tax=Nocardia terpenica TaxID=455432 RepID=A0A6G9Z649_9NOCA|nr:hypothetical protein [Nocardia terpenica]QIS20483.1 hypothetical protein F6W96_21475 [Nocardia terpenica]
MAVRQFPWTDICHLPQLLRRSWRRHRASGAGLADFTLESDWKPGPAAHAPGPYLFNFTRFTPIKATDVRQLGSLSVWTDATGLDTFISLPDHVEIMNKYRTRSLPLRSATWWSDHLDLDSALPHGLQLLDAHDTQRVSVPRA